MESLSLSAASLKQWVCLLLLEVDLGLAFEG